MAETSMERELRQFRTDFKDHTDLDESRHVQIREDITDQKVALAALTAKITAVGATAMLLIPALTELVHVLVDRLVK